MELICHTLAPVYDAHSRILVLGTMPSPKSRAVGFYYGHPQNRFWRVLAAVLEVSIPDSPEGKRALLLAHHIAMWDVLRCCEIEGAQDGSIRNPVANDFSTLLATADIRQIFTTGQTAGKLYRRLCQPITGRESICLPSTSAANCRLPFEALVAAYRVLLY